MKKKWDSYFWGSGTPTFWLGLQLFIKRESRTPTFKILVRTLDIFLFFHENIGISFLWTLSMCNAGESLTK